MGLGLRDRELVVVEDGRAEHRVGARLQRGDQVLERSGAAGGDTGTLTASATAFVSARS